MIPYWDVFLYITLCGQLSVIDKRFLITIIQLYHISYLVDIYIFDMSTQICITHSAVKVTDIHHLATNITRCLNTMNTLRSVPDLLSGRVVVYVTSSNPFPLICRYPVFCAKVGVFRRQHKFICQT